MGAIGRAPESYRVLGRWEKGAAKPELDDLVSLCKVFGCEIGYLLGEHDCKTRSTTDIQAETGLSEGAIAELRRYNDHNRINYEDGYKVSHYQNLQTINLLLENEREFGVVATIAGCLFSEFKSTDDLPSIQVFDSSINSERRISVDILRNLYYEHLHSCIETLHNLVKKGGN